MAASFGIALKEASAGTATFYIWRISSPRKTDTFNHVSLRIKSGSGQYAAGDSAWVSSKPATGEPVTVTGAYTPGQSVSAYLIDDNGPGGTKPDSNVVTFQG